LDQIAGVWKKPVGQLGNFFLLFGVNDQIAAEGVIFMELEI